MRDSQERLRGAIVRLRCTINTHHTRTVQQVDNTYRNFTVAAARRINLLTRLEHTGRDRINDDNYEITPWARDRISLSSITLIFIAFLRQRVILS
jgi:hypothetical protein